jgi:CheY-like chemotaxis protein
MPERPGASPILVVDDNEVNRKVAALFVRRLGFDAQVAGSGAEALSMMAGASYALVLMDCQMPEMDGYATAAAIRAGDPARRVPIVAVTADASPEVRTRDVEGVMDDIIEKPIRLDELGAVIRRWVG